MQPKAIKWTLNTLIKKKMNFKYNFLPKNLNSLTTKLFQNCTGLSYIHYHKFPWQRINAIIIYIHKVICINRKVPLQSHGRYISIYKIWHLSKVVWSTLIGSQHSSQQHTTSPIPKVVMQRQLYTTSYLFRRGVRASSEEDSDKDVLRSCKLRIYCTIRFRSSARSENGGFSETFSASPTINESRSIAFE